MGFPEKLAQLLKAKGMTRTELGKRAGLSQPAITGMTQGTRRPYLDQAAKMAEALDVSLDYLAFDDSRLEGTGGRSTSDENLTEQRIRRASGVVYVSQSWH